MVILSLLLAGGIAACDAASNALLAPSEASLLVQSGNKSLAISPSTVQMNALGRTFQLTAEARNGSGKVVKNPTLTWASMDPQIATVSATGLVTSVGVGTARITATGQDMTDTAKVEVRQVVAAISVTPGSASIAAGGTLALTAAAADSNGVNISGASFLWSSSNAAVATVSPASGVVTGVASGAATIQAAVDGSNAAPGSAAITVGNGGGDVPPPPAPPGQYSPNTPHWQHIRLEVTDFRLGVQVFGTAAQAEYDWTAANYDAIMDGNLAEYRRRNPTIKHYPYTLSAWFQAKSGDLYKGTDYLAMKAWYDDPKLNTQGYNIEEAFLHTGLPKTEQNRLVKAGWQGVNDWYANPGDPGYRAYSLYRYNRIVLESYAGQKSDGAFLDSFETHNLGKALGSVEYPTGAAGEAALFGAWETWTKEVRAHISRDGVNRRMHVNPAQYWNDWNRKLAIAGGSAHFEMGQSAESAHRYFWDKIADMTAQDVVSQMLSGYSRKHYDDGVLGATFLPGNEKSKAARGKLVELASYYMIRPGASQIDLVRYTLTNFWDRPFSQEWTKAIETDLGHPRENRRVYATGTFSFKTAWNSTWTWQVWGREYDKALVLIHSPMDKDRDKYGDDTAVTVPLPAGTWHMLYEDGTLGSAITSVTLRNAEAAILLKGS